MNVSAARFVTLMLGASGCKYRRLNTHQVRDAVISVYDDAGNVIETHEHGAEFKEW